MIYFRKTRKLVSRRHIFIAPPNRYIVRSYSRRNAYIFVRWARNYRCGKKPLILADGGNKKIRRAKLLKTSKKRNPSNGVIHTWMQPILSFSGQNWAREKDHYVRESMLPANLELRTAVFNRFCAVWSIRREIYAPPSEFPHETPIAARFRRVNAP